MATELPEYSERVEMVDRVQDLVTTMNTCRAQMETSPVANLVEASATYTLASQRLLELLPFLLKEHRRLTFQASRDINLCPEHYLSCLIQADTFHEEHWDPTGIRWRADARNRSITMTSM
jgi:hypothetical protein